MGFFKGRGTDANPIQSVGRCDCGNDGPINKTLGKCQACLASDRRLGKGTATTKPNEE